MDDLQCAIAFDRAICARGAQRSIDVAGGVVLLHDELKSKWTLNSVRLDTPARPGLDADGVCELADEHLGHLSHRYVVIDDAAAGERIAPELLARGWSVQRVVFMRWHGDPSRAGRIELARRIGGDELREVQIVMGIQERGGDGAVERSLTETLVAGEEALRSGTPCLGFGADLDGRLCSSATMFIDSRDGGIALIDEVGTLVQARGRGLARAVVAAAVRAALDAGCERVIIPADVDDWPVTLYERMGFERLGMQFYFALEDPPAGGRRDSL
jgi:GNAT superfamily N-acetyltransferase